MKQNNKRTTITQVEWTKQSLAAYSPEDAVLIAPSLGAGGVAQPLLGCWGLEIMFDVMKVRTQSQDICTTKTNTKQALELLTRLANTGLATFWCRAKVWGVCPLTGWFSDVVIQLLIHIWKLKSSLLSKSSRRLTAVFSFFFFSLNF